MTDTRKTQLVNLTPVEKCRLAEALRKLCRVVQDDAEKNMQMPKDIRERMLAINTMHNVFDRLDEAVDKYLKEGERS
jgi:DNA-binding protein H-NS